MSTKWRSPVQLCLGLILFGVSIALMINAHAGVDPWDVFHLGLAERTGLPIGWVVNLTAALVLVMWIPLRQRPGLGTVSNVIVVGVSLDTALVVLPVPHRLAARAGFLLVGIIANGVATGLYVGAGLGSGPRDGLMMGLAARGHSIRVVRTSIELTVLVVGWLLGGAVGVGTVVYAVSIGPLAGFFIGKLRVRSCDLV